MKTYNSRSARMQRDIRNRTGAALDARRKPHSAFTSDSSDEPMPSLWDGKYKVYRGKYKGRTWDRLPWEYLQFLVENNYGQAHYAALEMKRRRDAGELIEAPVCMPWGIHKNKPFSAVPEDYLRWVVRAGKSDMLVAAVEDHLRWRGRQEATA